MNTPLFTRQCTYCPDTFETEAPRAKVCPKCRKRNQEIYNLNRKLANRCIREDARHSINKEKKKRGTKAARRKAQANKEKAVEEGLIQASLNSLVRSIIPVGKSGPVKHLIPGSREFNQVAAIYQKGVRA